MNTRIVQYLTDIYIGKEPVNGGSVKGLGRRLSLDILWFLASAPHIFFVAYFLFSEVTPLLMANIFSVSLYIVSRFFLKQGHVSLTACLILIEIFFYVMISVYYLGTESHMQWYLLLVLIPVFYNLEFSASHQAALSTIVIIGILSCMLYGKYFTAPYAGSKSVEFFYYFNSLFIIFAMILEIMMENVVRGFVVLLSGNDIEFLREQSYRDPLTNLYNRRYADILFTEIEPDFLSRRTSERYVVAMVDIDDFKKINDQHGHEIGDLVLLNTVSVLQNSIRKDDNLFRWGGEEFLVVLKGVDLHNAVIVAQNLCQRIAQSVCTCPSGLNLSVTATIGLAPIGQLGFKDAIIQADQNMYEGKRSGKNCVKTLSSKSLKA